MFISLIHTASVHLRTSILYLASAAIVVSVILLFVASMTFQKQKDHWIWAVIPFVMMLVMLVPIINVSMWK